MADLSRPPTIRAGHQPPGAPDVPAPSGLFPSRTTRPTYREPHRVRGGALTAGLFGTAAWMLFFGMLGRDLRGYVVWTTLAGLLAWAVSAVLIRLGDRGVAVGVAISSGVGFAVAAATVALRWAGTGDWPIW